MAGTVGEESGVGSSLEGISNGLRCQDGDEVDELRSFEQVEIGCPSTSPLYWGISDDDEGAKTSELYGKHTWAIDKFSQINKRELRGSVFEVGGYKWYILIYPQGCDVSNHLSLFLCVANHDKLLPGWSHFAQFTIAVVNKDPKKSKYSDTLHRFWKKEHDWGWKKFMELSKVLDGFVEDDTLIIKAQVQVIREKVDRPFRCLDCQYRRELVRVYLSNVEQICRRFVEERRGKLGELIEDKARWSSFCTFWLGMDQNTRRHMSKEKTDMILKVVVKHFFIEKEVTSTLVMDSLYSGLKALEGQSTCSKGRMKFWEAEEMPDPIVCVEKDTFVLVDDVVLLLKRASLEPLPPKDEKGPQNRTKDGGFGEDFHKDSIERDERRLTELGRRTLEIFALAHIFSNKIEVAYQEAVALKRQEELIREEEAGLAETEQKAKRGATEKEKKSKKKQAKQRRNNRKANHKGSDDKVLAIMQVNRGSDELKHLVVEQALPVLDKAELLEDPSDASDSVDCIEDNFHPDSEERDSSPVNWDTDTSEVHHPTEASSSDISGVSCVENGIAEKKNLSVMDDSSSTCSTDSVPSVATNGPYKGNTFSNHKTQKSPRRGNHGKLTNEGTILANETDGQPSGPAADAEDAKSVSGCCMVDESKSEAAVLSLQDRLKWLVQNTSKKDDAMQQKKLGLRNHNDVERPCKEKMGAVPSPSSSPPRISPSTVQVKAEFKSIVDSDLAPAKKSSSSSPQHANKTAPSTSAQLLAAPKANPRKPAASRSENATLPLLPAMLRPSSGPLIPGPRPPVLAVSIAHTAPSLARSVSASGQSCPELSPETHSFVPQSYRNAIVGNPAAPSLAVLARPQSSSSAAPNPLPAYSQPQASERMVPNSVKPSLSFGTMNWDVLQNGYHWIKRAQRDVGGSPVSLVDDMQGLDLYRPVHEGCREQFTEPLAGTSGCQTQGMLADDFPHLDIINDLLNDEHSMGKGTRASTVFPSLSNGGHCFFSRQYSLPANKRISDDLGSPTSSCSFDRLQSYQSQGFQRGFGSSGIHLNSFRDYIPQGNQLSHANGQIDGMMQNQWWAGGSDLSLLSMAGSPEGDAYSYPITNYTSLTGNVNGYTVFRPSNGL